MLFTNLCTSWAAIVVLLLALSVSAFEMRVGGGGTEAPPAAFLEDHVGNEGDQKEGAILEDVAEDRFFNNILEDAADEQEGDVEYF